MEVLGILDKGLIHI